MSVLLVKIPSIAGWGLHRCPSTTENLDQNRCKSQIHMAFWGRLHLEMNSCLTTMAMLERRRHCGSRPRFEDLMLDGDGCS